MAVAEKPTARTVKGIYDGKVVVPSEPLDVPAGTEVLVHVEVGKDQVTWAAKRLGLPNLVIKGGGPTGSEIIIEERGPR